MEKAEIIKNESFYSKFYVLVKEKKAFLDEIQKRMENISENKLDMEGFSI